MVLGRLLPASAVGPVGSAVVIGKEVLVVVAVLYLFIVRSLTARRWIWPDVFAVGMGLLAVFYMLIPNSWLGGSDASFIAKLVSARSILVPPLLYFLGRWLSPSVTGVASLVRFILKIGVFSLLVGVGLTALSSENWHELGLSTVYQVKFAEAGGTIDKVLNTAGFPTSWFFQDLPQSIVPWPGVRRLSSMLIEPITTGLVTATLFIISVALPRRHRWWGTTTWLLALGVLLSLSRGGFLLALLGYSYVRVRSPVVVFFAGASILILGLLVYGQILGQFGFMTATSLRGGALVDALDQALKFPQGRGLGTVGFFSGAITGEAALVEQEGLNPFVTETFVGTLAIQVGITGVLFWLSFALTLIQALDQIVKRWWKVDSQLSRCALGIGGGVIGLFVIGFLTSSGYGFVGLSISFVLAGLVVGVDQRESNANSLACATHRHRSIHTYPRTV